MNDERQDRVYLAALAGLLHDIGKFAQRAGWMGGKHAEVGGEFVRKYVPEPWRAHLFPVMAHHDEPLPTHEAKIIALADRLSAGERVPAEEAQPQQLLSIFCRVTADKQRAAEHYWPLERLEMREEALFPAEKALPKEEVEKRYQSLWKDFEAEASKLACAHGQGGFLPAYLESMLLLFQRYTWCIPSAYYRSLPDVSLYDHSRTTAALAVCLMGQEENSLDGMLGALKEWHEARKKAQPLGNVPPPPILRNTQVALLVGGDISGVQDFIYTITARGATSALRGRSFYLQLLTEAMARFVLRSLGLPITNLLYQGGGHFYLLARPEDEGRLREVSQTISEILWVHHQGDLYLALGARPLTAADFYDGRISTRWEELSQSLRRAKQRRFAELDAGMARLFAPEGHGGNEEQECQVCGREHPDTRPDDGVRKCPPCHSYEKLGESLRHAQYLWLAEREAAPTQENAHPGGWEDILAAFGFRAGAVERSDAVPRTSGLRWVLAVKDEAMAGLSPDSHTVVGRRLLVNVTPILTEREYNDLRGKIKGLPRPESVKPFEVMEYQSQGVQRLGVLRMDVDNLGPLFSDGLGTEATFSRVASLSFAVSLFFEGWVEVLAERIGGGNGSQRLYSIYSGGDDLFFVGSWDAVVELARAIRADLTRYAAGHPGIHTSAGIALVGGKYPLYQAAREAGENQDRAKALMWWDEEGRDHKKDAIAFLGQVLPWPKFGLEDCATDGPARTAHRLAHQLQRMVEDEKVPRSVLQMLIQLQEMYEEAAEARRLRGEEYNRAGQEQALYGPWMWRGYYFLKRRARQYRESSAGVGKALDDLAELLYGDNFRAIEWVGLAARWAELLVRD